MFSLYIDMLSDDMSRLASDLTQLTVLDISGNPGVNKLIHSHAMLVPYIESVE
jgi:hypothetical protein